MPLRAARILRRLALLTAASLGLLLLAEGGLRLLGVSPPMSPPPRFVADEALFFRGVPGALVDGPDPDERLNHEGFRDRDRSPTRPDGTRRVLFVGDSFVYGLEVARDESLPQRLESRLERTEVWNLGMPSWTTIQQEALLRREVPRLRPDAVVLALYVGNDLFENLTVPDMTVVGGRLVTTAFRDALSSRHALRFVEGELALRRRSHLYSLLVKVGWTGPLWTLLFAGAPAEAREREQTLRKAHFESIRTVYGAMHDPALRDEPVVEKAFAATFRALDGIAATLEGGAAEREGPRVPWLLVLVPDVEQTRRSVERIARATAESGSEGTPPSGATSPDGEAMRGGTTPWAHARLRGWADAAGVPWIDLLDATLADDDPLSWYEPGGHWSAKGHARAADAIEPRLVALLRVP